MYSDLDKLVNAPYCARTYVHDTDANRKLSWTFPKEVVRTTGKDKLVRVALEIFS